MKKNKKQRFISDKISELRAEGKNQQESIAIALSMAENMLKEGGNVELPKYQGNRASGTVGDIPSRFMFSSDKAYQDYLKSNNITLEKLPNFGTPYFGTPSKTHSNYDTSKSLNPAMTPSTTYTGNNKKSFNFTTDGLPQQRQLPGQLNLNSNWGQPLAPAVKAPLTTKSIREATTQLKQVTNTEKPATKLPYYINPNEGNEVIAPVQDKYVPTEEDIVKSNLQVTEDSNTYAQENIVETPQFKRQTPPIQFANPGGVDLNAASALFGQSLQQGDTAMGIASGAKLGLGLARNFMSGYSAGVDRNGALNEYGENMRNAMTGAETPIALGRDGGEFYQEGGEKETYYATALQKNPNIDLNHPSFKNLVVKGEHFDKNLGRNVPNMQTPIEYRFSVENRSSYGDGSSDLGEYTFMPERDYKVLTEPDYNDLYENKSEYSSDERLLLAKKYRDENVKKGRVNTQVYGLSSIDYNGIKDKEGNYINTPASEEVKKEYNNIQQYRKEGGYIYQQGGKKAETPFEKYLKKYPNTSSPQDTIIPQGVMLDADIKFKKGQRNNLNDAFAATYFGYDKDFERFEDDKAEPVRKTVKKM